MLAKIGVNGYQAYKKTKKKAVVSARDFVVDTIQNYEQDGTLIICGSSTNCKADFPPVSGVVRGETPISGHLMQPINGDRSKTWVTIINEVDQKGHIPEWAMRTVMKDQGYQIDKLRKVVPKWKEQHPNDRP
jgi:hypothetical protein